MALDHAGGLRIPRGAAAQPPSLSTHQKESHIHELDADRREAQRTVAIFRARGSYPNLVAPLHRSPDTQLSSTSLR